MAATRRITVAGGNLYRIAAQELGAADQWSRIALANGLDDPVLSGVVTLLIPPRDPAGGNGGVLGVPIRWAAPLDFYPPVETPIDLPPLPDGGVTPSEPGTETPSALSVYANSDEMANGDHPANLGIGDETSFGASN